MNRIFPIPPHFGQDFNYQIIITLCNGVYLTVFNEGGNSKNHSHPCNECEQLVLENGSIIIFKKMLRVHGYTSTTTVLLCHRKKQSLVIAEPHSTFLAKPCHVSSVLCIYGEVGEEQSHHHNDLRLQYDPMRF